MTLKIVPILILILCALSLGAGCAAPTGGGGGSSGGTQPPQATQASGQGSAVTIPPGPVVTVPPNYDVTIQVNRNPDRVYPYITVAFRAAKEPYILQRIQATVVRSDGQVKTQEIDQPENGQISAGESMTFTGTTGIDRVIVVVTILGTDYKIYDQNLDFNSHP